MSQILFLIILIVFNQSNALDCNCRFGGTRRILGGQYATDDFLPWRILILEDRNLLCGGLILAKRYVLTAAHCVFSKQLNKLEIVVGLNQLDVFVPSQSFYNLDSIYIPNGFDINRLQNNDIALLRLNRDIQFVRGKVEAACLRFRNRRIDDLFIAGFGAIEQVDIINGVKSQGIYGSRLKYTSFYESSNNRKRQYITAIAKKQGEDACLKDGGEPGHILINGKVAVVGVTSFSTYKRVSDSVEKMCNGVTHLTRLSYQRQFIESYVNQNYCRI